MPARMIATIFALAAFAVMVVVGMLAGNPALIILWRALMALVACYVAGRILGALAQRAVREHIEQYKQRYPISAAQPAAETTHTTDAQTQRGPTPAGAQPMAEPSDVATSAGRVEAPPPAEPTRTGAAA